MPQKKHEPTETGQTKLSILVPSDVSTFSSGGGQKRVLKEASDALSDLGTLLQKSAEAFLATLEKAGPDEIKLGLNVAIEAEGNWLIVGASAEATASVEITWKRRKGV